MLTIFLMAYQGTLSRLSGNGFGKQWNISWLPEVLFALPFGLAFAYSISLVAGFGWTIISFLAAWAWSYGWMQSGTWPILPWDKEGVRDPERSGTLRPVADWIAEKLNVPFDSESYAWIYAALKGFLIGLPVGGIPLAILWPVGYEIGSHADKLPFKIDETAVAEVAAGVGAGLSIALFLLLVGG